jgi:hypothetical protein
LKRLQNGRFARKKDSLLRQVDPRLHLLLRLQSNHKSYRRLYYLQLLLRHFTIMAAQSARMLSKSSQLMSVVLAGDFKTPRDNILKKLEAFGLSSPSKLTKKVRLSQ